MQVTHQLNVRADRPRYARPPLAHRPSVIERPKFRPEPEGLSREELQKIVLEMIG